MIRVAIYNNTDKTTEMGDERLLSRYSPNGQNWLWLDLDNVDTNQERELLSSKFGINELAITDAQRTRHPPKFEAFDNYLFLLLRGLSQESDSLDYQTIQIACFIGKNILITRHSETSLSINRTWLALENKLLNMDQGPLHVALRVARNTVDRFTPILLALEDRLETLENEMLAKPNDLLLIELVNNNSHVKKLRRTLAYQRDVFATLLKQNTDLITSKRRHEINDVYEQFERLSSLANLYQELINDLINGYLSLSAHRLNKIMKVLTIVTVVFLPLGLLAGIYGMNFEFMPELKWQYGYFIVLGAMISLIIGILFTLRKLKWL